MEFELNLNFDSNDSPHRTNKPICMAMCTTIPNILDLEITGGIGMGMVLHTLQVLIYSDITIISITTCIIPIISAT